MGTASEMRDTPAGIVEELRFWAKRDALEFDVDPVDTTTGGAADYIERLTAALERIRSGASDPEAVAREALDPSKWVRLEPLGNAKGADIRGIRGA